MVKPLLLQYHSRPITQVKFNKDGDLFLSCSNDARVTLIKTETGERLGVYEGHEGAVKSCDINLESTIVVSGGADSKVCFYRADTGEVIHELNHGGIIKCVEFNQHPAHNNRIVTCADKFKSDPHKICVWRFDFEGAPSEHYCELMQQIDQELPMKATKVKWGPFDETLISVHEEGTFCVWDVRSGAQIRLIEAHHGPITGLQFNDDRTLMLTCSKDRCVKLWETQEYKNIKKYESNRPFNDCAISPLYKDKKDPKFHIIAGGGVEARDAAMVSEGGFESVIFNMVLEEEVATMRGHFGPMNSIGISADGMSYATGGEEGLIRLIHFDKDYLDRKDL